MAQTAPQLLAEGIRHLAVPFSLAAILNLSLGMDLPESILTRVSSMPLGGDLLAGLLSAAACCGYLLWSQHREWTKITEMGQAAKRAKRSCIHLAPDFESLAEKQARLQDSLKQAEEDIEQVRREVSRLPHSGVSCTHSVHVRMGRSTDAADKSLVADIVAMVNQSYRHAYADVLVTTCGDDAELAEDGQGTEEVANFTRTSSSEVVLRLQMCSDPSSARKLLLAFDSQQNCLGCCSVTAPYGKPRLGEWGLVCVAMRAQGQGIGSLLVAAAEAHCILRGCDTIQLEYFSADGHNYSARLRDWYLNKLGYQQVHHRECGNHLRGHATRVQVSFEVCHKRVTSKTVDTATQLRLNLHALEVDIDCRRKELRKLNNLAILPSQTLTDLPEEIMVQLLLPLCGATELCSLAMSCRHLRNVLRNAPTEDIQRCWHQICHSIVGGTPTLCYRAEQLLGPAESFGLSQSSNDIDWKLVYHLRHALPFSVSIVADVGRGYTRFGLTQSGPDILPMHVLSSQGIVGQGALSQPPSPMILQLCSSPSHPPDASSGSQFSELLKRITPEYRRLIALKAIVAGDDRPLGTAAAVQGWQWPAVSGLGNIIREAPLLVGEPFWLLKRYPGRGHSEAERRANQQALEEWRVQIEQQCANICCIRFVPQPYLAMVAHGIPASGDALVLNLGMRECVACAVIGGRLVNASVQDTPIGGSTLTMLLLQHLANNPGNASWLRNDDMTWCRDQKEKHCFVRLPGEDLPGPVEVGRPRAEALLHGTCLLADERWLVPEVLFDPQRNGMDGRSITAILASAAVAAVRTAVHEASCKRAGKKIGEDGSSTGKLSTAHIELALFERLLSSVVVVGGASGLPNLRRRIEMDLSAAVETLPEIQSLIEILAQQEGHGKHSLVRCVRLKACVRLPACEGKCREAGDTVFDGGCALASSALGMERSLNNYERRHVSEATCDPIDRNPAPWLTRVKMAQTFREQCLSAVADARAAQGLNN